MANPFLGQISMFGFGFAPTGWAQCNGQLLPISQNQALFALLGTQYGGNGTQTFALPNLQGRAPLHFDNNNLQGAQIGVETVPLTSVQIPVHTHQAKAVNAAGANASPSGGAWAVCTPASDPRYAPTGAELAPMKSTALGAAGSGQAHQNMQPFLTINFCIALQGIFPSRN